MQINEADDHVEVPGLTVSETLSPGEVFTPVRNLPDGNQVSAYRSVRGTAK